MTPARMPSNGQAAVNACWRGLRSSGRNATPVARLRRNGRANLSRRLHSIAPPAAGRVEALLAQLEEAQRWRILAACRVGELELVACGGKIAGIVELERLLVGEHPVRLLPVAVALGHVE